MTSSTPTVHSREPMTIRARSESPTSALRLSDAVTETANGLDGVGANLAPQSRDEHLERVRVAIRVRVVDVVAQLALRHHAVAMVHQIRQHAELLAGQLDLAPVERHARAA